MWCSGEVVKEGTVVNVCDMGLSGEGVIYGTGTYLGAWLFEADVAFSKGVKDICMAALWRRGW